MLAFAPPRGCWFLELGRQSGRSRRPGAGSGGSKHGVSASSKGGRGLDGVACHSSIHHRRGSRRRASVPPGGLAEFPLAWIECVRPGEFWLP